MPKYTPETEKAKAISLSKSFIRSGLNQSRLAEKEGVTSQAISQRLRHNPRIQETLAEHLKEYFPKSYLRKKFFEGLQARRKEYNGKKTVTVKDLNCRHKYLVTLLETQGNLQDSSIAIGIQISCGSELISGLQEIEKSQVKSRLNDNDD